MRKTVLALCSLTLLSSSFAQQTPSTSSQSTAPAKAPTASNPETAPVGPPPPANPLTDAQAKQMLEMTGALKMKEQLLRSVMNYFRSSMTFMPSDVSEDL